MHAARHGWDLEKDAPLFKNWAIHTGNCWQVCCPLSLLWRMMLNTLKVNFVMST